MFNYGSMNKYYPMLVDLTSNLFALWENMKVHLYNYLVMGGGGGGGGGQSVHLNTLLSGQA